MVSLASFTDLKGQILGKASELFIDWLWWGETMSQNCDHQRAYCAWAVTPCVNCLTCLYYYTAFRVTLWTRGGAMFNTLWTMGLFESDCRLQTGLSRDIRVQNCYIPTNDSFADWTQVFTGYCYGIVSYKASHALRTFPVLLCVPIWVPFIPDSSSRALWQ
jgi:hypothetical protein